MSHSPRWLTVAMLFAGPISIAGCGGPDPAAIERAEVQVRRIADTLDRRTTETGVYVRAEEGEIDEDDPWGSAIRVSYSQGGIAEVVSVRSAGPDRRFHTDDDLVAEGMAANLKGVGEGIKKNTEEVATKAAKGLVKGAVEGVKESIKDALPFGKGKQDEEGEPEQDDAE